MIENVLNIFVIRKYVNLMKIDWTNHCLNRLNKRNISIKDVKNAINSGKIIEYYYNDFPYPSCLISGVDIKRKNLHIVCGISSELVHIITAYYPNSTKWEKDMKTRRKK